MAVVYGGCFFVLVEGYSRAAIALEPYLIV